MKRQLQHTPAKARHQSSANEDGIVLKIARKGSIPDRQSRVRLGIGDDAALFSPRPGYETVLTSDWFLEGSHFLLDRHPADSVGWKCLARAVSDVAAMGGEPRCFLLNLALPPSRAGRWLDAFLSGLRRAQRHLRCPLAGGDTTQSERILAAVTVIGEIASGKAVLRSGARPGDSIFVSGGLGEAESGLRHILSETQIDPGDPKLRKHLYPEPHLRLGSLLSRNRLATAMMDLSDGLSTDLGRLCTASGVGARIDSRLLPIPEPGGADALSRALHGGDDYELLFTVARANLRRITKSLAGVKLTRIGTITPGPALRLVHPSGCERVLGPGGWDSFRVVGKTNRAWA